MAPASNQFVTVEVAGRRLALPASDVREVIGRPRLTTVPQAPAGLLGLANFRGAAVPVLSLATLLDEPPGNARRIVVMEGAVPVGLAVDAAFAVVDETAETSFERIDLADLIARRFAGLATRAARRGGRVSARRADGDSRVETRFLSFTVGRQDFALPLDRIDAVIPLGDDIAAIPDADAAVLGTAAWRNALLPLLSLAILLGRTAGAGRPRVVVVRIAGHPVGLVVDAIDEVTAIDAGTIDPVPAVLSRGGGEARIAGIARLDGGHRLLSLLDCDMLVDADLAERLRGNAPILQQAAEKEKGDTETLLLFSIAGHQYGLPLTAVDEVARMPDRLTPLRRAPAFVRGVMHLRGRALMVIDQAARFGAIAVGRRLIVARSGGLEAGFLVDAVTGVVRVPAASLLVAPAIGAEPQMFDKLVVEAADTPFTLLVSPFALLAQAERELLEAIGMDEAVPRP
jgi:purine-binding chemotaxis protein CheW